MQDSIATIDWYSLKNPGSVDSPALLVYPDRIAANIRHLVAMAGQVNVLRPHVKTHKMTEVTRMLQQAGIRQFKCATIAEAEMLAETGAPDILLAHQPVGPKAFRLRDLVIKYPDTSFSAITDHPIVAAALSAVFAEQNLVLPVFIDLNTGMKRTGIPPEKAWDLYQAIQRLPGIRFRGLHAYDGHVRSSDLAARKQMSDLAFAPVQALADRIYAASQAYPEIVVAGTPSFPTHIHREHVAYSPGTFVFWDWGYDQQLPDAPFVFAALVLTRIISVIDEQTVCLDLGHKSIAAENPLPRVHFLDHPEAKPVAQSEEHLVVEVPDSSPYQPGDCWYGVPVHICPTVALYDQATVVRDHEVIGHWQVEARKRKIEI
ncbi:MAG TPA: D-TA family PLP-dependent enzyme [Sediminibacterium sp.]|nr:D-TA family PLP-dependent enzyme [Sediminibacterium sp.]